MRTLFDGILRRGKQLLDKDPKYLDRYSFQGHYPIGIIDLTRSHGPYLYDVKGTRYYDATAFWNTNILDYKKYPELQKVAVHAGSLVMDSPTMSELNTMEQAAFVDLMTGYWPKAAHVFTEPSGSLAVTDACWTACVQVAEREKLKPQEMKAVVFEGAFHGRHDRSADATNTTPKVDFRQYPERFIRCSAPVCVFDRMGNEMHAETKAVLKHSMSEVEHAFRDKKTAYVIIEYPFQAEGGARVIAPEALKLLNGLCQKYRKLLIVDCVQMCARSWSLTGKNAAPFPKEALRYADMITFGKVFRLSGFMARDPVRLKRGFKDDVMSTHPLHYGSTWVGRTDQAIAGCAILETVTGKKLWKRALVHANRIRSFLRNESKNGLLMTPRGRPDTAYVGWEFGSRETRDEFLRIMRDERHILLLTSGEKSIRWAPFADATASEIGTVLSAIHETCETLRQRPMSAVIPKRTSDRRTMTPPAGRSK